MKTATRHRSNNCPGTKSETLYRQPFAVLVAVLLACAGPPAHASLSVLDRFSTLALPRFLWQDHEIIELSGVPMHLRSFATTDTALQAAQALARHTDLFQRVLTLDRKVVLSGMQSDWHWLAEIDGGVAGTTGRVSALPLMTNKNTAAPTRLPRFAWLPPQAQRRFDYRSTVGSEQVIQQIYSAPLSVSDFTAYVRKQLRNTGWKTDQHDTSSSRWRLDGARLTLYSTQGSAGTALYVHYVK